MDDGGPPAKRRRLSMACNECRRRKVKCDTDLPQCRNCRLRNEMCITTDPKRPNVSIAREWVDPPDTMRDISAKDPVRNAANVASQSPRAAMNRPTIAPSPASGTGGSNWSEDKGISPAQQPFEMTFNTDATTDRIKMMGGSSSQCLMKSFDVYLESARITPLITNFRHGMRYVEEMEIPLLSSLPALPESGHRKVYVQRFFDRIQPIYPLFDVDQMKTTIEQLASIPEFHSLPHEQVPLLVSAYLIVSIGADEEAQRLTEDGSKYLIAAAGLLGNVILIPYFPAIQTLFLFTLAYRGRNKDGIGWQTLGMAIRTAYTLGLHRHSVKLPSDQHGVKSRSKQLFHARVWGICCSLEKMMQLESGRPSLIDEVDRDQMMGPHQHAPGHDFLQWHMELARLQGLICHHIYGHKPGTRTAQQILSDTARLDRSLVSWTKEIPEEFRPGHDLFCSNETFHIAAFLSIQYYQAVIALHRAALISPAATFLSEVANHNFDNPSSLRLQAGEAICVSSARSIARLGIELSDRNIHSRILNGGPQLLACIVLGISLLKNPGSRIVAADLELLKACVEYTTDQFLKSGHSLLFSKGKMIDIRTVRLPSCLHLAGITSIYQQVRLYIDRRTNEQLGHASRSHLATAGDLGIGYQTTQYNHNGDHLGEGHGQMMHHISEQTRSDQTIGVDLAQVRSHAHSKSNVSFGQQVNNVGMSAQLPAQSEQDIYSDQLPFDNLNVEELWSWMGNLNGYDNYRYPDLYQGPTSL